MLVFVAGCSSPASDGPLRSVAPTSAGPATSTPTSGDPIASTPRPPQSGGATPSATSVAAPDLSGSGCFPGDVPNPLSVTAFAQTEAVRKGDQVRIVIEIRTSEVSEVQHRHGQEFDAAVVRDGTEVWRWSTVAPLVDPYAYKVDYKAGEVRRFSAVYTAEQAGSYDVHGYLIGDMQSPPPPGRFICFDSGHLTVS